MKRCMAQTFCATGEIGCKHWCSDMDMDPFCMHPEIVKDNCFGLYTGRMQQRGICGPSNDYALHEKDDRK